MSTALPATATALLEDHSLEVTARDAATLLAEPGRFPPGTQVSITSLAHEDAAARVAAAGALRAAGYRPTPHIAARRVGSPRELTGFLTGLRAVDAAESVCVVAGDPARPAGPYPDSLALLRSGLLEDHGVRHVSVGGYPEGHPGITDGALWDALQEKASLLAEHGLAGTVVTQFCFDADRVLDWLATLRQAGVDLPVRIGAPGPTGVRQLLALAARFGVASSAGVVRKYGFGLTDLVRTAGPDQFVRRLAEGLRPEHGAVRLHLYTFGAPAETERWVREVRSTSSPDRRPDRLPAGAAANRLTEVPRRPEEPPED